MTPNAASHRLFWNSIYHTLKSDWMLIFSQQTEPHSKVGISFTLATRIASSRQTWIRCGWERGAACHVCQSAHCVPSVSAHTGKNISRHLILFSGYVYMNAGEWCMMPFSRSLPLLFFFLTCCKSHWAYCVLNSETCSRSVFPGTYDPTEKKTNLIAKSWNNSDLILEI